MRVIGLFRVSTSDQEEHGASLDAQQRRFRELAANGWTVIGEFRGCESASGAATERRVLQQVLACIREQKPDAIWVIEQSRLTRGDPLEVALLLRELGEARTKIIINAVVRDLSSIDERFMVGIQSLVDRTEAERIKERVMRAKLEKAKQGKKNSGSPPYGYLNPPYGDPRRGILQIVPEEANVVRRIFTAIADGDSDRDVCRMLNSEGIKPPRGRAWARSTVRRMLDQQGYLGTHISNRWVRVQGRSTHVLRPNNGTVISKAGAHEAIISRELWDRVQSRSRRPTSAKPRLLTGLLYVDGKRFRADGSRGRFYYRACDRGGLGWLPLEETEQIVWDAFVSLATGPEFVSALIGRAQGSDVRKEKQTEHRKVQALVAKLEQRLEGLVEMRAGGEITKTLFQEHFDKTRSELVSRRSHLQELEVALMSTDVSQAGKVVKAVQALVGGQPKLTTEQKSKILRSIVKRIDATLERGKSRQPRSKGGMLASGPKHVWTIKNIHLQLEVPNVNSIGCSDTDIGCCGPRRRR